MAAKVLEDVLNHTISVDSILEWLSCQNSASEVNVQLNQYKCNQIEFASYFLNFLRVQSSMILQSSCSVDTPCKNSQLRKIKNLNVSSDKSGDDVKSERSPVSTDKNLDFQSLDSFPSLTDGSNNRTRNSDRNCSRSIEHEENESPGLGKDTSKKGRRIQLFPENDTSNAHESSQTGSSVTFSTPKASGKESVDVADYFNDVMYLDECPELSPAFKWKREMNKTDNVSFEKAKRNSGMNLGTKPKSYTSDPPAVRSNKDYKSHLRVMLGDFIVNDSSSGDSRRDKKNKVRKRINPTRVHSSTSTSQFEGSSSFDMSSSTFENGIGDERQALKMERSNLLEKLEGKALLETRRKEVIPVAVFSTPSKSVLPTLNSATFVDELKILSQIYSAILNENYCQNVMIEFCFVISLLVIQDHTSSLDDSKGKESRNLLNSVHNCVYFAVEMLWLQRNVLVFLNLAALKLLSENAEIAKFNVNLKEFLSVAYAERQGRETVKRPIWDGRGTRQGNVSFQCETDNIDNFTNEISFHSFKKQRDLFYNILSSWEENHLSSGWVFSQRLQSKIHTLLTISSDPTNLLHLARLFRSQLVMSCCADYQIDDESNEEILQLLASVDPDKIMRLRARLRSTPKRQGPCPLPDFMGYQEFFKDFIIATSHSAFQNYLKNSLCDEILRLNEIDFSGDLEDEDSCLDQQAQVRYLQQINVLCLLAKFLGYLEFLPYRSEKQWSDRVVSVHCSTRQHLLPLFDVESCLRAAFTKHKLTITVPWIVSYLSMIDVCSARLQIYQRVWKILITVYRQLRTCKNLMNSFYLKLTLGWIFQLPNFPADLFYNVLEELNKNSSSELSIGFSNGLDSYNFIEENILYSVCPFLNEINAILTEKSGCNVKHIRPVTAQSNLNSSSQMAKQIELRLEESFMHNQSSSTRRTIELVIERVSSVAVKHLINDIVPKVKEEALKKFDEIVDDASIIEEIGGISEKCFKDLISTCETESWKLCSVRCEKALSALLSIDIDKAVKETCSRIAIRQSTEKVKRWIQDHVTLAIIKKEFLKIVEKRSKKDAQTMDVDSLNNTYEKSTRIPNVVPAGDIWPMSYVLIRLRELMMNFREEGEIVWGEINHNLKMTLKSVEMIQGINPSLRKTLFSVIVDLLIIICIQYENQFKKENLSEFYQLIRHLNEGNPSGSCLERLICPRNLALFQKNSKNKRRIWENLGRIFVFLMEEDLLTQEQTEAQLLSLLKNNWKKEEGILYSAFYTQILNVYSEGNSCDKFSLLLEYLLETLNESDDFRGDYVD